VILGAVEEVFMTARRSLAQACGVLFACSLIGCAGDGAATDGGATDGARAASDAGRPSDARAGSPDGRVAWPDGGACVSDAGTGGATVTELAGRTETITNASWFNIAWDTKRQVGYATNWSHDLWVFDGAKWTILLPGKWGAWHNCSMTYDPVNDRLWETVCASETDPTPDWVVHYLDLSAQQLAWVATPIADGPSYDPAYVFDPIGRRIVSYGGWGHYNKVLTFPLDPIGTAWTSKPLTGPSIDNDAAKMTNERSGWDEVRQVFWYVHTDGAVWTLDQGLTAWTQHVAGGDIPPPFSAFGFHPVADRYVAWYSGALNAADVKDAANRAFYTLDPATYTWTRLGGFPVLPVAGWYTTLALIFDPCRDQLVLKTNSAGGNWDPQTWALKL
jgi:hypothetical protein